MLLCVYGSLKKGFPWHDRYLKDTHLRWEGWMDGWKMINIGPFPTIQPGHGCVRVEVYDVSASVLQRIQQNPMFQTTFRLTPTTIQMDELTYEASVFVIPGSFDFERYKMIDSGEWTDKSPAGLEAFNPDFDLFDDELDDDLDPDFDDDFDEDEYEDDWDDDDFFDDEESDALPASAI